MHVIGNNSEKLTMICHTANINVAQEEASKIHTLKMYHSHTHTQAYERSIQVTYSLDLHIYLVQAAVLYS